jgi:hypothetical protein
MASEQVPIRQDTQYVLVSSDGEPYWKDCIDILLVPNGYEYHFRYQKKWLERGITAEELNGKRALIVAQLREMVGGIPLYVPLRYCQITQSVDRGAFVAITFTLGSFVSLGADPHTSAKEFDKNLRDQLGSRIIDNGLGGPFAFRVSGLRIESSKGTRIDDDWISLVRAVALSERYHKTVFLGLRGLEDTSSKQGIDYSKGVFEIKAGSTYMFRLAQYMPDTDASGATIKRGKLTDFGCISLGISGGDMRLLTPSQDIRGKYDDLTFAFTVDWAERSAVCNSHFTGTGKDGTYIPSLSFNIRVTPSRQFWVGFGIFVIGVLSIALVSFVSEKEFKILLTGLGAVFSAIGMYFAKRVL